MPIWICKLSRNIPNFGNEKSLGKLLRKHFASCQCFPICPPRENIVACQWKQNLLPGKQKCFPINSETFLLQKEYFPVCPHVSSTIGMSKKKSREKWGYIMLFIVSNIFDLFTPNVSTALFCSLPTLGNTEKQWKETMFLQQSCMVFQGLTDYQYSKTAEPRRAMTILLH